MADHTKHKNILKMLSDLLYGIWGLLYIFLSSWSAFWNSQI